MTGAPARQRKWGRSRCAGRAIASCAPQPVVFSPVDPHILYFAANTIWKTRDGGDHWQEISPDLSRKTWEVPASVGKYQDSPSAKPTQRGVVYALAPSPLELRPLWAGTDDGLIHLTTDGGLHWKNVTPPATETVRQSFDHRCGTLRQEHRLCGDQHACGWTICGRTSCARTTMARPGRRL